MKRLSEAGSSGRDRFENSDQHFRFRFVPAPPASPARGERRGFHIAQRQQTKHRDLVRGAGGGPDFAAAATGRFGLAALQQGLEITATNTPSRAVTLLMTSPRISGSCTRATVSASCASTAFSRSKGIQIGRGGFALDPVIEKIPRRSDAVRRISPRLLSGLTNRDPHPPASRRRGRRDCFAGAVRANAPPPSARRHRHRNRARLR